MILAKFLKKGLVKIVTSVDAGTEETFKKVMGEFFFTTAEVQKITAAVKNRKEKKNLEYEAAVQGVLQEVLNEIEVLRWFEPGEEFMDERRLKWRKMWYGPWNWYRYVCCCCCRRILAKPEADDGPRCCDPDKEFMNEPRRKQVKNSNDNEMNCLGLLIMK